VFLINGVRCFVIEHAVPLSCLIQRLVPYCILVNMLWYLLYLLFSCMLTLFFCLKPMLCFLYYQKVAAVVDRAPLASLVVLVLFFNT